MAFSPNDPKKVRAYSLQANSITQFRTPTISIHNPNTSYGSNYNPDCGEQSRAMDIYKQNKYRGSSTPKSKPHVPYKSDKEDLKIAHSFAQKGINNRRLFNREINKPLDFKQEHFNPKTAYDTPVKLTAKISPQNLEWLRSSLRQKKCSDMSKGKYIPSMSHLDLYGRRTKPSKFEERALWKPNNPFAGVMR